jgi:hypothetical protein
LAEPVSLENRSGGLSPARGRGGGLHAEGRIALSVMRVKMHKAVGRSHWGRTLNGSDRFTPEGVTNDPPPLPFCCPLTGLPFYPQIDCSFLKFKDRIQVQTLKEEN